MIDKCFTTKPRPLTWKSVTCVTSPVWPLPFAAPPSLAPYFPHNPGEAQALLSSLSAQICLLSALTRTLPLLSTPFSPSLPLLGCSSPFACLASTKEICSAQEPAEVTLMIRGESRPCSGLSLSLVLLARHGHALLCHLITRRLSGTSDPLPNSGLNNRDIELSSNWQWTLEG